jgi:hypothetical protein
MVLHTRTEKVVGTLIIIMVAVVIVDTSLEYAYLGYWHYDVISTITCYILPAFMVIWAIDVYYRHALKRQTMRQQVK